MDCKELMIGDWIEEIHDSLKPRRNFRKITDQDFITRGVKITPIPLTPEILEKNGWKEAQFWHEYQDEKNTIQSCLPDMRGIINGVEIQHFKCEYVHQYQHLLRLCGLNELADNFKI